MPWHADFEKLDKEYRENFKDLRQNYLDHARKTQMILSLSIVVSLICGIVSIWLISQYRHVAQDNRRAVAHLCKTSAAVSNILDEAADNFKANLDAGVYEKKMEKGLITQEELDKAKEDYVIFKATVKSLRSPGNPCQNITGKTTMP